MEKYFKVNKEYKEIEEFELRLNENNQTIKVPVKKTVLSNSQSEAFEKARKEAVKEQYASVSLTSENDKHWEFMFYNKQEVKDSEKESDTPNSGGN